MQGHAADLSELQDELLALAGQVQRIAQSSAQGRPGELFELTLMQDAWLLISGFLGGLFHRFNSLSDNSTREKIGQLNNQDCLERRRT